MASTCQRLCSVDIAYRMAPFIVSTSCVIPHRCPGGTQSDSTWTMTVNLR